MKFSIRSSSQQHEQWISQWESTLLNSLFPSIFFGSLKRLYDLITSDERENNEIFKYKLPSRNEQKSVFIQLKKLMSELSFIHNKINLMTHYWISHFTRKLKIDKLQTLPHVHYNIIMKSSSSISKLSSFNRKCFLNNNFIRI